MNERNAIRSKPIATFKGNGLGQFELVYADGEIQSMLRSELMWALQNGFLHESEATAFKYADCIPNEVQTVS